MHGGFAICVKNRGCEASLERRKVHDVLVDEDAEAHQQIRVIDESGEDCLLPVSCFVLLELAKRTRCAVVEAV